MAYGTVAKDGSFTLRTEPYGEGRRQATTWC